MSLGSRGGVIFIGLFIFNLDYYKRISFPKLTILVFLVVFMMQLFEKIRGNPVGALQGDIVSLLIESNPEFIYNNHSEVYYSSIRMVGLIDRGLLPVIDRLSSFFYFLLSIFTPYSLLPPLANLGGYKQELYTSGGGGLISVYSYVWGGCFLTILMGVFVSYISSNYSRFRGEYLPVYALFVISQVGTWFPYNPIGLFKICFYAVVIEFFFLRMHNTRFFTQNIYV